MGTSARPEPPYQVAWLAGVLVGASIDRLREIGWTIVDADIEGCVVQTPSGMRLRVQVAKIEVPGVQ